MTDSHATTAEPETANQTALEEFREELPRVWQRIPDKRLFFALLGVWLLIFQFLGNSTFGYIDSPSLFAWMYGSYNSPHSDDDHGNLIPFVVLALLWWKRKELLAVAKRSWWPALIPFGLCVLLHVVGYSIQQPRVSIVAMFGGVYALVAAVWGWRLALACLFPYFLFAFSIPVASIAEPITVPLRWVSTDISVVVARSLFGIPVIQEGVRLLSADGTFNYEVAAACSGIRSLIALFALMTVYAFTAFRASWKRLLVMALALPLAIAGNVLRLTGIMVVGEAFGQDAGEWVHDWFGFVPFLLALLAILGLGRWLGEASDESPVAGGTA